MIYHCYLHGLWRQIDALLIFFDEVNFVGIIESGLQLRSVVVHNIAQLLGDQMFVRICVEFSIELFTHQIHKLRCD